MKGQMGGEPTDTEITDFPHSTRSSKLCCSQLTLQTSELLSFAGCAWAELQTGPVLPCYCFKWLSGKTAFDIAVDIYIKKSPFFTLLTYMKVGFAHREVYNINLLFSSVQNVDIDYYHLVLLTARSSSYHVQYPLGVRTTQGASFTPTLG